MQSTQVISHSAKAGEDPCSDMANRKHCTTQWNVGRVSRLSKEKVGPQHLLGEAHIFTYVSSTETHGERRNQFRGRSAHKLRLDIRV